MIIIFTVVMRIICHRVLGFQYNHDDGYDRPPHHRGHGMGALRKRPRDLVRLAMSYNMLKSSSTDGEYAEEASFAPASFDGVAGVAAQSRLSSFGVKCTADVVGERECAL